MSNISMRTRSPKRRNGVAGLPLAMVSRQRISAMQAAPVERSRLDTVPEPTMDPASSSRVFATWAMSWVKSKVMSSPALGLPNSLPLSCTCRGRCSLRPSHAPPSSSAVTATGENAVAGFDCRKPKPLANSAGMRFLRLTSFASISSLMCAAASSAVAPMGTSSVITATSPSMSMPQSSLAATMASHGPMKLSDPPWYMSGSVQKEAGMSALRAFRTSSTWFT